MVPCASVLVETNTICWFYLRRMEEIRRKSHLRKDLCPPFVPRSLSITRISRTGRLKATGRRKSSRPKVHLHCSSEQAISSIKFASFGTPLGTCGSYQQGPSCFVCHLGEEVCWEATMCRHHSQQ